MTDLGTLGGSQSLAFGLNNNGQIVGRSSITGDGAEHSFLYDNGTMYDLNTLTTGLNGYVLGSARAINDSGWIVGFTEDGSNTQAWLLTPTGTPLPGGIPEPSRTLLLAGASVTLLLRRRRNLVCENDSGR